MGKGLSARVWMQRVCLASTFLVGTVILCQLWYRTVRVCLVAPGLGFTGGLVGG